MQIIGLITSVSCSIARYNDEKKYIKVGFEISFGTCILIFFCPLYLCTVGRDKSMYGYVLESLSSCFGCRSETVPTTRSIAAFPQSTIQSSHQNPFSGLVKGLWHEGGQTRPVLTQHTQVPPRGVHYFLALCFTSTKTLLVQVKWNTNLMQHCAGFISAGSRYMFRAQAPIIRSI